MAGSLYARHKLSLLMLFKLLCRLLVRPGASTMLFREYISADLTLIGTFPLSSFCRCSLYSLRLVPPWILSGPLTLSIHFHLFRHTVCYLWVSAVFLLLSTILFRRRLLIDTLYTFYSILSLSLRLSSLSNYLL